MYSFLFSAAVEDPEFTDIIENITVAAGRNVKFACSVKNLGTYKVSLLPLKAYNKNKKGRQGLEKILREKNTLKKSITIYLKKM